MKIEKGYPFYGQSVGILVFNQKTPRIPGDPGHNGTFSFPVCYQVIEGSFDDLITGSKKIEKALLDAALALKARGVKAIVGDCGLMAIYQNFLAKKTGLPTMSSALSLIPLIWTALGKSGTIGILTGHSEMLSEQHLLEAGVSSDMNVIIQGLQEEPHFAEVVIDGTADYSPDKMRTDVLNSAKKLLYKNNDLKAIIIECSNLPTFSRDLHDALNIPVFDIALAANIMHYCVHPQVYIVQ